MKHRRFLLAYLALMLALVTGTAVSKPADLPEVTEDGLHRVPDSRLAIVYAEPGADLALYKRVKLLDAYVAFKKNWERNQRSSSAGSFKVTSRDIEKIKTTLAEEFYTVFKKTLEDSGYGVVDESGDDVLLVRPAIINLDVNAPDTPRAGSSMTFTSSAGEMTLYVELYDSVTGDLMAKALDRRIDNNHYYTWTNSVTNKAASEKILKGWATILVQALDEARQR